MAINRRDFLLLRREGRSTVLSCESLFMRFIDAENDGTIETLFANLARDLAQVKTVRLSGRSWLARPDLRAGVEQALDGFRRRGGRVEDD